MIVDASVVNIMVERVVVDVSSGAVVIEAEVCVFITSGVVFVLT